MTTKITIENGVESNGDVHIRARNVSSHPDKSKLLPGEKTEFWITDSSMIHVIETWPTTKPPAEPAAKS